MVRGADWRDVSGAARSGVRGVAAALMAANVKALRNVTGKFRIAAV